MKIKTTTDNPTDRTTLAGVYTLTVTLTNTDIEDLAERVRGRRPTRHAVGRMLRESLLFDLALETDTCGRG